MKWTWEKCARFCEKAYGIFVDWDEEFFICPECDEPIYKCDWEDYGCWTVCPICEFDFIVGEMPSIDDEEDEDENE